MVVSSQTHTCSLLTARLAAKARLLPGCTAAANKCYTRKQQKQRGALPDCKAAANGSLPHLQPAGVHDFDGDRQRPQHAAVHAPKAALADDRQLVEAAGRAAARAGGASGELGTAASGRSACCGAGSGEAAARAARPPRFVAPTWRSPRGRSFARPLKRQPPSPWLRQRGGSGWRRCGARGDSCQGARSRLSVFWLVTCSVQQQTLFPTTYE